MTFQCICPEYDCGPVSTCINNELLKVSLGTSSLSGLCTAVSTCVDAEFEALSNGSSSSFNFFPQAVVKTLLSFSGFSDLGDFYLTSQDGVLAWIPSATFATVYMSNSPSVNITGDGSSGNPFLANINSVYTHGLFGGSNGLAYTAGQFKLGGSLSEDTTIAAGGFDYNLTGADAIIQRGVSAEVKGSTSGTNYSILTLTGAQGLFKLVDNTEVHSLEFNNGSSETILSTTENLRIQDGTSFNTSGVQPQKTFLKISNYHQASTSYVLTLLNTTTGEVGWSSKAAGVSYTDEQAQDAVGGILTDTSTIDFTYSDSTPSITADVKNASVTFAKIQNVSTDTLVGRDTASTGSPESISVGGGIEFTGSAGIQVSAFTGDVTKTAGGTALTIANNAVTDTKFRDSTGYSVIGRSINSAGDPSDIIAPVNGVLRRSGSGDLLFDTIVTANIGDDQVTFDKIQNVNTSRVIGRSTAGTGSVEELTIGNGLQAVSGTLSALGRNLISISTFFTNGTWTRPAGCNAILVYTTAGGGGGAGANANSSECAAGSGGGAGATSVQFLTSSFGSSESVIVGAGGAAGSSINSYTGQTGGTSSFGSLSSVVGGSGGSPMTSGTSVEIQPGGSGGLVSILTTLGIVVLCTGETGSHGFRVSSSSGIGGLGGSSIYGGGGNSPGSGGNGSTANNGTSADGGAGVVGRVIVYAYS